jgi:Cof subfamily protein (haloacid dehalogenase superfamily)
MGKKLIFFDIDGTLISHVGKSHIPAPTVQAVKELTNNGHVPAIATARNLALTRKTAAFFDIDLVVCCNGAHVTRIADGRDIYESWFGDGFLNIFRASASSVSRQAYALDAEHVYTDWEKDFFDAFVLDQAGEGCKKNLAALERAQLAYVFSTPPETWLGRDDVDAIEAPGYTEFRPRGVSKWSGIVRAAAELGFDAADVVAVGDGLNDVEMVENASIGIAVGGASDRLKAVADVVADDIDDGGILSIFRSLGMA